MTLAVTISGVPVTVQVDTLTVDDAIEKRTTANFTVVDRDCTAHYDRGQPVVITSDNGIEFSGRIDTATEKSVITADGATVIFHEISCADWHSITDNRIVAASYENMRADLIVADLVTTYLTAEGITYHGLEAPMVTEAIFNYVTLREALDSLTEKSGFIWYIDFNKVLHFVPPTAVPSNVPLTQADILEGSLIVENGNPQYRNKQYVKGGREITDVQTEIFKGDGVQRSFALAFPLAHEPVIEVNNNPSILSNPGFEGGLNDWIIFSSAPSIPGNDRYEIVTTEKRSGSKSLHIVKSDYTSGAVGVYHTPIPVSPGETWQASAYIKGTGTDVRIQLEYKNYLDALAWQDTFDTDQLATQYTSGGDTPATWTVSNGVLTGTGGVQATLLKKNLILQNCKIVVNSDWADDGGIIARYQDNNNYYLLALCDDSAPYENLRLYRRVNGAYTLLASANVTWPRGTAKQIIFTLYGSSLEVYFDGVKVISVTDTTYTSGMVGLRDHDNTVRVLDWAVYYAQQAMMVEEGTNLLPANQSDVETDLSGLYGWGSVTLSRDTTTAWHGTASAKATASANSTQSSIHTDKVPVTAGSVYSASVYAKTSVPRSGNLTIWWYDSNNAMITNHNVSIFITTAWQRFVVTGTAPSNAVSCHVELYCYNLVAGDNFWWDGAQLEAKAVTTSQTFSFQPTSDWQYVSISGIVPANTMSAWLNIYSYGNCDIYVDDCELKRIYSVGIKGIETGKDFYWSKGDNVITQDALGTPLSANDTLTVKYKGMYEVVAVVADQAQVEQRKTVEGGTGLVEDVVEVPMETSASSANETAIAKLRKYGTMGRRVKLCTTTPAFESGMYVHVIIPRHGIDTGMLVESSSYQPHLLADGTIRHEYSLTLTEGPVSGGWERVFTEMARKPAAFSIRQNISEKATLSVLTNLSPEMWGWRETVTCKVNVCILANTVDTAGLDKYCC